VVEEDEGHDGGGGPVGVWSWFYGGSRWLQRSTVKVEEVQ